MGRWSQRRRGRGGGPPSAPNQMIAAQITANIDELLITYSADVDATDFDTTTWNAAPSGSTSINATQTSPNQLTVSFDNQVNLDATTTYFGTAPEILTPQTIAITI